MIRAVLDTSVLVSALLEPLGPSAELLRKASSGAFELLVSETILDELKSFLCRTRIRKRLENPREESEAFLIMLSSRFDELEPGPLLDLVQTDPDDNHVIAAALSAAAHYLVTGDKRDLLSLECIRGVRIVSPRQFIEILESATIEPDS